MGMVGDIILIEKLILAFIPFIIKIYICIKATSFLTASKNSKYRQIMNRKKYVLSFALVLVLAYPLYRMEDTVLSAEPLFWFIYTIMINILALCIALLRIGYIQYSKTTMSNLCPLLIFGPIATLFYIYLFFPSRREDRIYE